MEMLEILIERVRCDPLGSDPFILGKVEKRGKTGLVLVPMPLRSPHEVAMTYRWEESIGEKDFALYILEKGNLYFDWRGKVIDVHCKPDFLSRTNSLDLIMDTMKTRWPDYFIRVDGHLDGHYTELEYFP